MLKSVAAPALLLGVAAAGPATDRAGERVISGDGILPATIDGTPVRIRIDPAAPAMPLIDRAVAERLQLRLKGKWGVSIGYRVGGTAVMTRTQLVRLTLGGSTGKRRIGWADRPFAPAADGSVGPAALPEPIVRFQFAAPRPGERVTALRAVTQAGPLGLFGNFAATFGEMEVGGQPMRVRFDPYHARTLATAGAAVRLARIYDGTLSGEAVPTPLFFGVERPVRTLTLRRPLTIGPLAIATLGVRTADYGSVGSIAEAGAPAERADPDEVVVTAKGKRRDPRRDMLSLGADVLQHCSSLAFDKPAGVIRLTCS